MGIGTLLIFIAIVLSSAVASVLIIFATQQIVQQAQQTALDTSAKASKQLEVIAMMGDKNVNGTDNASTMTTLQMLEISLRPVAGSPDIYLNSIMVDIIDETKRSYLNYNSSISSPTNESYYVAARKDDDGSITNGIVSTQDVFSLFINTGMTGTGMSLSPQTEVKISIVVTDGLVTYEDFIVPAEASRFVPLY